MITTKDPQHEVQPFYKQAATALSINTLNHDGQANPWTVNLDVNGNSVNFKLDTGAEIDVLPKATYNRLYQRPKLSPTSISLTAYNGTNISVLGKCTASIKYKKVTTSIKFIVADTISQPVLGATTCEKLNLIKRIFQIDTNLPALLKKYQDCFGALGTLQKTHHITIDPSVPPVINPPRKIPFALRDKLKVELDRMTKMGIIKSVSEPTEWVNSLVIVEKPNGSLRICLDPRNLNKAIQREHFQIPTAEEIFADMHGAKFFSKIDASNGFWQIPVDEDSSKLLTFSTPFGRYKFTRLPYGIHSASEIFQIEVSRIIEGIEGARNMQDDIIVWAPTLEEHHKRLSSVLDRIQQHGLKLNKSKCVFLAKELIYLGHKITPNGLQPDPSKVKAIANMPHPKNKEDLQRFLGMTNYLCKFLPKYSEVTAPLRLLLQNDVEWSFDQPQRTAIDDLKNLIVKQPILQFFNPSLPTKISTDSSKLGLGAILQQKGDSGWQPVAYASRATTPAEQNYCPLEREALSVLFGCKRFHEFVYGRHFVVENDHKPLPSIFQRQIAKAPPRVQRFMLALQRYDFDLQYIPGKEAVVPDTLSRAFLNECEPEISTEDMEAHVHLIEAEMPMSDKKLTRYRQATSTDKTLQLLKKYTLNGWPEKNKVELSLTPYYNAREDITLLKGLLLKGKRIIVPNELRREVRNLIHSGHQGIDKCLAQAKEHIYWPGVTAEIKDMINNCSTCLDERNRQSQEPIIPHDIPETPWTKIGADIFDLHRKSYVIVVDYTTKFFDIHSLPDKQSTTVINHLKSIFAKFGIPQIVMSDGGPEFKSDAFKRFAQDWDFQHDRSSALYPQSNGLVERTIQTVKRTLKKAMSSSQDPYLALLALRTTPFTDAPAPATQMMGRRLRTILPHIDHQYENKQKNPLTSSACELPELNPGDSVRVLSDNKWKMKGRVLEKLIYPRSYLVETEKGTKIRRNRRHLLKTKENIHIQPEYDYESILSSDKPPANHQAESLTPDPNCKQPYTTRSGRRIVPPARYEQYS